MNIQKLEPINLANLSQKTEQEVFDHVKNHLLKQKKQSIHYGKCYYRLETPEGVLKCAAGCLISDEEYKTKFEDNTWMTLIHTNQVPPTHKRLIECLQLTHDNFDPQEDTWETVLKDVADKFNLTY